MAYLVVGESVAGVAAALELAAAGCNVEIIFHTGDSTGMEDSFLIGATPLNGFPMRGTPFADLTFEKLHQAGVHTRTTSEWLGLWDKSYVDATTEELVLDDTFQEERHRFQGAVFAPSGSEPGLSRELEDPFMGRGLSYSAWSDGSYFKNKRVAVVGCGYHAFEQALIAAEHAASVTVLSAATSTPPLGLLENEVLKSERLVVRMNTQVLSLQPHRDGSLGAIVVEEHGQERVLEAEGVFVAHDPVVGWWAWGNQEEALAFQERGKLVLAGIAAGVAYAEHGALFESGVRAARQLLAAAT